MSRLSKSVSPSESSSDHTRQPGMKRTFARLPGCPVMRNTARYWLAFLSPRSVQ